MGVGSSIVGMQLNLPQNPTAEELDRIFGRITDYKKGLIPVQLQPGDSVVKQFVLRTRGWLFFTPLTHKFQMQVNYSGDGLDHSDTIVHELTIRSTVAAVTLGAIAGAVLGTALKSLTEAASVPSRPFMRALASSVLASLAVVLAFARKNSAQAIISVEDFWGGALIGFSTGFFGFEQFRNLFQRGSP
jgi:hypothetical protein